jgi:RNA polymerase sigma factor (sigma-70 family)
MATSHSGPPLESLLVHAEWLRALARCLAASRDEADDLVQQTWMAAAESPPDPRQPARPWLAEVMRNFRRMRLRASARRHAREQRAVSEPRPPAPGTDALLEQLELQRSIARLLSELEEPYRTTILLRFYQGHPASDIAAEQAVPAGTVRWRISEGLRRLRQRLDEAHGGRREAWSAVLLSLPIAPAARVGRNIALLGAGTVALGLLGGLLCAARGEPTAAVEAAGAPSPAALASQAPADPSGPSLPMPRSQPPTKEHPMMRDKLKKAVVLFGAALPALVAGAEQRGKPLARDEAIAACLEFKEKSLACKEELADHFAAMVPPERRAKIREKAMAEMVAEGSGPLEPRRNKCASDVDGKEKGPMPFGIFTDRDLAAVRACEKESECKKRVECAMGAIREAKKRAAQP